MKTNAPLSYFGADSLVAEELAKMLDHCKHVTIPFCGGMSILPYLKARAIVANDLNSSAIEFYRVMSGEYGRIGREDLIWRAEHTLSHPAELERARDLLNERSPVRRAWAYWAISWLCRKGSLGTTSEGTGMPSTRRTAGGGTNASRIRSAARDLEEWAKEFERCEWKCDDFLECIADVCDNDGCGIYADPCWIDDGDDYLHSMKIADHVRLHAALNRFKQTTVVIRYGDHPMIRELYEGWRIIEATGRTQANQSKPEIWITNNGR